MNFFQQQEKSRRKTKFLIIYFLCGVIGTIFTIYIAVMFLLFNSKFQKNFWDSDVFIGVSTVTFLIIAVGSIAKLVELSHGGGAVARTLGGVQVPPNPTEFDLKRLINVVNEMSIASGVPVPEIYLLNEDGINAFAAGNSPKDAAIGITQGAIKYLNRDELQGVVAHEFSHILNGDMRLNMKLIATISGILTISTVGYYIIRAKTSDKNSGQIKIIGLALLIIGFCGALFARIIQASISRQREFLADASAVQFTRNPDGIAGALKKIANLKSLVTSPATNEAAHLFFSSPISGLLNSLFATHPPIEERIKAILGSDVSTPLQSNLDNQFEPPVISNIAGKQRIKAENLISTAGIVSNKQINYAQNILSSY
ncbi:MAG TPA: M48 family metallopeptidase, partial [Verrucomicrobiota bacterium]|nr:M48 family metallopeptidase [Verrucomicrobiota bacterium]